MTHHTLHRRAFLAAALLAAGFHGTSFRAQTKPEKSRLTLAVDGEAALYHLPLTIADQLGFFKAEGLEVDVSDLVGGARSPAALPGGVVDVFAGAFENTIHGQAKGQMFQSFVLQGRAPQIAFGISTHSMPPHQTLALGLFFSALIRPRISPELIRTASTLIPVSFWKSCTALAM